jgi:hypothetical protein
MLNGLDVTVLFLKTLVIEFNCCFAFRKVNDTEFF